MNLLLPNPCKHSDVHDDHSITLETLLLVLGVEAPNMTTVN
jgi:hypothetical protein